MRIEEASDAGGARVGPDARARFEAPDDQGGDGSVVPSAVPSDVACATEEEERMLRFRRELRDEVGAAEDHLAILVARRERREAELARAEAARDASTREADVAESRLAEARRETERLRRQIAQDAPRGDRLGDEILALQVRTLRPPPTLHPRRPFFRRPEPAPTRTAVSPADPTLDPYPRAQNTIDEEARLAADAHSTARAHVEALEARVEDQRRRLRDEFGESGRLEETRRSRRLHSTALVQRRVFAKLIEMRGLDWSIEDARWIAEEWARETRKLESYLE